MKAPGKSALPHKLFQAMFATQRGHLAQRGVGPSGSARPTSKSNEGESARRRRPPTSCPAVTCWTAAAMVTAKCRVRGRSADNATGQSWRQCRSSSAPARLDPSPALRRLAPSSSHGACAPYWSHGTGITAVHHIPRSRRVREHDCSA